MTTIDPKTHSADTAAIDQLHELFALQKSAFRQNMMPSYAERIDWLTKLEKMVLNNQTRIAEAVEADFGTHPHELTRIAELLGPVSRARFAKKHLRKWMRPQRRPVDRMLFGLASNWLMYQPVGVIGNMSPWNFPIDISFGPLADTLAAGNRVIIKPSESAPHCAELIKTLIGETYEPDLVGVVTGGLELAQAFTEVPWDHLLFTGGPEIGAKVLASAAKHLTPVTLELGGKNPTIMTEDKLDLESVTAIMATKMVKSGQMCITSDYVFVPEGKQQKFVDLAQQAIANLYPKLIDNNDSTSIINGHHYDRLQEYLADAQQSEAEVIEVNPANEKAIPEKRKMPLYLVVDPAEDLLVMRHEIFGPILPIKGYNHIDEVIDYVNDHERPLALYVFSKDQKLIDKVINNTISGGVSINAVALHPMQASLPFGGSGRSGVGHHHGFEGFVAFSKAKPIFRQFPLNGTSLLFPPYGKTVNRLLDFLLR